MVRPIANALLAMCILAVTTAAAAAKQTPFDLKPAGASEALPDNGAIFMGPAGAMLELDYFRAPHGLFKNGNGGPCRLHRSSDGETVRLAYSCR